MSSSKFPQQQLDGWTRTGGNAYSRKLDGVLYLIIGKYNRDIGMRYLVKSNGVTIKTGINSIPAAKKYIAKVAKSSGSDRIVESLENTVIGDTGTVIDEVKNLTSMYTQMLGQHDAARDKIVREFNNKLKKLVK